MTEEMKEVPAEKTPAPAPRPGWRVAGWFGIRRAPDRWGGFKLRWRFYFFSFLFFLCVSLVGVTSYSESPSFCRSCHIMEPYYQAWANSKHHGKAKCVDCHYPPGETKTIVWKKFQALSQVAKFVTRTYSSKPYAEVDDASCLRSGCHSTRLLQGQVVTPKGVRFDHKPHIENVRRGRQLRCASCHSQVVVGKHIEVTYDTCYLCHFKGRAEGKNVELKDGCLGCHKLPDKVVKVGNITYNHQEFLRDTKVSCAMCHQDAVRGAGEVDEDRCRTCHNEEEKLKKREDVAFVHDNHVTKHNTACFHCHREMKHGATPAGTKKLAYDCGMCHSDMHDLQRNFYTGTGARGVPDMPSPMYLANVDCAGCHKADKPSGHSASHAKTEVGSEKGCVDCHGKEYTGILKDSHDLFRATVAKLKEKHDAIRKGLPEGWERNPEYAPVARDLDEAAYNLAYVSESHMVHNIYYAASILRAVEERLTAIAKKRKIETEETASLPVISGRFCATLCHARVGVKVPPFQVTHKGKAMPHDKHFEEMACTNCHLFGQHKSLTLKTPKKCAKCHEDYKD
ncbi:MAG: NapC/NirT family cytochrome c [Planctomycetes bacterium]|nr:NapC/NirT family cytochrome c [Planctomycetota bacterium]